MRIPIITACCLLALPLVAAGAPVNDNFVSAQVISGISNSVSGGNAGAGREAGEPDHAGNSPGSSVWYAWTAPTSGTFVFETSTADFDTVLAVYQGTSVSTLAETASNDDIGSFITRSRLSFVAAQGSTYQVAVEGSSGATGSFTLAWYPGWASLNEGLDHPQFSPSSSATGLGDPWFLQTTESHDGYDALQSGALFDGERTELNLEVEGPAALVFWWKVSCEEDFDNLYFLVNGQTNLVMTGTNGTWSNVLYSLSAGTSVVTWAYEKDFINSDGTDAGWVDQVTVVPRLAIGHHPGGGSVRVTWPLVGYGLKLQSEASLEEGTGWTDVPGPLLQDGTNFFLIDPGILLPGTKSYRLTQ